MAKTRKLRFMKARGNPYSGAVVARGSLIEMPEPWASKFIADGTAVEVDDDGIAKRQSVESKKKAKKVD